MGRRSKMGFSSQASTDHLPSPCLQPASEPPSPASCLLSFRACYKVAQGKRMRQWRDDSSKVIAVFLLLL